MSAGTWAGLAVLGGLGAVLRHIVDSAMGGRARRAFPFGIFVVNVSGAFALGLLAGSAAAEQTLAVAGMGLLGAFTTFSTWMLQTRLLAGDGRHRSAGTYVIASLVVGFVAIAAGRGLA